MRPEVRQFTDFLVADMVATEDTTFCEGLLSQARAKITAGAGEVGFFQNGTVNGKTFTRATVLTCLDVAYACRTALNEYNDEGTQPTGVTFVDFSGGFSR